MTPVTDMPTPVLSLREDAITWTRSGEEVVVLDLRTSTYLGVNEAAAHLWLLLVEGTTEPTMIAALCEMYGIGPETAAVDVASFLAEMERRGLLIAA